MRPLSSRLRWQADSRWRGGAAWSRHSSVWRVWPRRELGTPPVINSHHAAYGRCPRRRAAVSPHVAAGLHRDTDLPRADYCRLLLVHPGLSMTALDWIVLDTTLISVVSYARYAAGATNRVDRSLRAAKSRPWSAMPLSIRPPLASAITFISTTGQS